MKDQCKILFLAGLSVVAVLGQGQNNGTMSTTVVDSMAENDGSISQFIEDLAKNLETGMNDDTSNVPTRRKRSVYGYGSYPDYNNNNHYAPNYDTGSSYGGYGNYGNNKYGGYNDGHGQGRYDSYGYQGRNSYDNQGYNNKNGGYLNYDKSYSASPILTFVKGFKPGKSYVEKGKVIRNYYRHGTYEVALQHYKFIPVIKVVPYTTYDTVGYTGHIRAENDYTAKICKDCYHGYSKIDITSNHAPYNMMTRRYIYLPNNYQINNYGYSRSSYGHENYHQNNYAA